MEYAIEFNRLVKLEMEGVARVSPRRSQLDRRLRLRLTGGHATRSSRAAQVDEPAWLLADRLAAVGRVRGAAGRAQPAVHHLPRPAPGPIFGDADAVRRGDRRARAAEQASLPAGGDARSCTSARTRVVGRALSAEARAAGVVLDTFADVLAESARAARRAPGGRPHAARRRQVFAQLTRAPGTQGVLVARAAPASACASRSSSAGASGRPAVRSSTRTVDPPRQGRPGLASSRSSRVEPRWRHAPERGRPPEPLVAGTCEVLPGRGRDPRRRGRSRTCRPDTSRFSTRQATIGEGATLHWALAQRRRPARPQPGRQPARRATAAPSSRSRSCFGGRGPALRPDQLHAPHRPRHDRQPAQSRAPSWIARAAS